MDNCEFLKERTGKNWEFIPQDYWTIGDMVRFTPNTYESGNSEDRIYYRINQVSSDLFKIIITINMNNNLKDPNLKFNKDAPIENYINCTNGLNFSAIVHSWNEVIQFIQEVDQFNLKRLGNYVAAQMEKDDTYDEALNKLKNNYLKNMDNSSIELENNTLENDLFIGTI